jgi:hypothetical protein
MRNKTQLWLSALAAVAALMLGSPAQAKTWVATYDPPAYIGTGTFDVNDACLASDGAHQQSDFVGCTIKILSNISTAPAVDFVSILNSPFGIPLCGTCEYEVLGGKFAGVNTGVIGSVFVGDSEYWFQFLSSYSPGNNEDIPPSVTNFVNLYDNCSFDGPTLFCGKPAFVATEVGFAVPEPGPLALIVGAMGAGWLVRRRKSAV